MKILTKVGRADLIEEICISHDVFAGTLSLFEAHTRLWCLHVKSPMTFRVANTATPPGIGASPFATHMTSALTLSLHADSELP